MANSAMENKALTAIRGFAALWVVVFHLNMSWSFPLGPHAHAALVMGYVAVDVFFVLSGFILTLVYPALIGRDGSGSFALRRICRIYPLHLCIMTALGLAGLYTEMRHQRRGFRGYRLGHDCPRACLAADMAEGFANRDLLERVGLVLPAAALVEAAAW